MARQRRFWASVFAVALLGACATEGGAGFSPWEELAGCRPAASLAQAAHQSIFILVHDGLEQRRAGAILALLQGELFGSFLIRSS